MKLVIDAAAYAFLLLGLPPLLLGIIARVKAFVAGRSGAPLLQPYRDLARLLRKGAVYSRTTTWVFRAGPVVTLATTLAAGCLLPLRAGGAPLAFEGDLVLFAYLLGLGRFLTVCAALDTGSSFEGMGASREAAFSALAEAALFLVLVTLVVATRQLSLSAIFAALAGGSGANPALWVAAAALAAVLLAENARIPIDDPATHLELTMIHEVMVLDHGGPDFAFIVYSAALKLWLFTALIVAMVLPATGDPWLSLLLAVGGTLVVAVVVGVIESVMARLRLVIVPQLLVGAGALVAVAFLLSLA